MHTNRQLHHLISEPNHTTIQPESARMVLPLDLVESLAYSSFDPALPSPDGRSRSYTLDSFNISSIESSKPHRVFEARVQSLFDHNVETATWIFSDILQSFSVRDNDIHLVITKSNQLVRLLQENPALKHDIVIEHVINRIHFMFYHPTPQLRCAAYRILRHTCVSQESLLYLVRLKILISVIVTLSTPSPLLEKEEALKLIREFLSLPSGANYISVGVIKALVALVEHENEEQNNNPQGADSSAHVPPAFTRMCIETICEMAVLKPEIVFHGGGLRLMMYLIINGSSDIASTCLIVILTLLDRPDARLYLRNGIDLDSLISVYSYFEDDDDGKHPNTRKYYNRALKISFLLTLFLKCWTGLICFSHNKFDPLKVLLSNLKKKNNKLRSMILDLLLDILRIKALPWLEDSSIGEIMTKYFNFINPSNSKTPQFEYHSMNPQSFEFTVISHYQGLLLKVLLNCDIVPLIFDIIDHDRENDTTMKATYLLTNIFSLAVKLLPREFFNAHIFNAYRKTMSLTSISRIESATRMQMRRRNDSKKKSEVKNFVKDMTIASRLNMDDNDFKVLISNTKLLTVKEFDDWNWTLISLLFQGPLRNHRRFAELQEKYPKLLKSILSFFRPFKYRFSNVPLHTSSNFPKLKNPKRIILIGCQLIESLLSYEAGFKFLATNKLMPQLAEIFAQVDPFSGIEATDPILSKRRLENTLSIGYIKFVGVLSGTSFGLCILEQWQFFHILNNIIEGSAEDELNNHLIFNLLNNLNFALRSPLHLLLSKSLNISNWKTKVFALENIVPKLLQSEECETLAIENLVNLLYDENEKVVNMSVDCLHDFYIVRNNLRRVDVLVGFKPSIAILSNSKEGRILLLNFCKTTNGFRFLQENGFIEQCFNESIKDLQGFDYLTAIESSLRIYLTPFIGESNEQATYSSDLHHFFKYLLATEDGFNFFNNRRQIIDNIVARIGVISRKLNLIEGEPVLDQEYSEVIPSDSTLFDNHFIRNEVEEGDENPFEDFSLPLQIPAIITPKFPDLADEDANSEMSGKEQSHFTAATEVITVEIEEEYMFRRLKQYIWLIGEIASSNHGIQFLDPIYSSNMKSTHVVETMFQLFQRSSNWQIRGLAFFQLGKLASTLEGVEMLDDMQWVSHDEPEAQNTITLAYPKSMQDGDIFNIEILNPYEDASYYTLFGVNDQGSIYVNQQLGLEDDLAIESYEKLDDKILSLISHLSSVLSKLERKAMKELNFIKAENPQVFENVSLFLKTIRLVDQGKFKYRIRNFIFGLFNTLKIMENLVRRDRKVLKK